ncbi:MAG: hypothetical protein ACOX1P_11810 [Thermoguttaceae bacterium]
MTCASLVGATFGQQALRFEAEDITEPKDAWLVDPVVGQQMEPLVD